LTAIVLLLLLPVLFRRPGVVPVQGEALRMLIENLENIRTEWIASGVSIPFLRLIAPDPVLPVPASGQQSNHSPPL